MASVWDQTRGAQCAGNHDDCHQDGHWCSYTTLGPFVRGLSKKKSFMWGFYYKAECFLRKRHINCWQACPQKLVKEKAQATTTEKKIIINHLENANSQTTVKYYLTSIKMLGKML